jgi:hypothetical protein
MQKKKVEFNIYNHYILTNLTEIISLLKLSYLEFQYSFNASLSDFLVLISSRSSKNLYIFNLGIQIFN